MNPTCFSSILPFRLKDDDDESGVKSIHMNTIQNAEAIV